MKMELTGPVTGDILRNVLKVALDKNAAKGIELWETLFGITANPNE
jgi:hypothetical protein